MKVICATAISLLVAIPTGGASAAITTEAARWFKNGSMLSGDQAITATIGKHNEELGSKFTLKATISNKPIHLTATGLECVGCNITNSVVTSGTSAVAMGKGKIKFTGVTAMEPAGCTVRNGSETGAKEVVETKALEVHADFMHEGKAFQQFFPEAGATKTFMTIYLEGGECTSIAGPYQVTGTVYSEAKNRTGVEASTQEIVFSSAIQTTTGAELKFGENRFELTGSVIFSIGGASFSVH